MINYESAWEHLKHFISEKKSYEKKYDSLCEVILLKMKELEENCHIIDTETMINNTKDIKIGDYTLKRSGLQFTKEDFEAAKKAWEQDRMIYDLAHDLEQELLNFDSKVKLEVDRWVFDAFKDLCGCTTPDEVFNMMTTPLHIYRFKSVIEAVNNKIKHLDIYEDTFTHPEPGKLQYNPLHGYQFSVPKEPFEATEELRNAIKQRWEEVYNET